MLTIRPVLVVIGVLALALPVRARAEDNPLTDMGVWVGGGVVGFVDQEARNFVDVGGAWEARVAFQPGATFSVEGAYVGSLQGVDVLGLDQDARLLGSGAELALKVNFLPGILQPYVVVGAGWTRYDLTNTATTADITDQDDVLTVPLGAGFAIWFGPLVLDFRGTYRATSGNDMFAQRADESTLDSWRMTMQLGFAL